MKPFVRFQYWCRVSSVGVVLLCAALYSAEKPTRIDFYDRSANHLMYMNFHYEGDRLTGRTLYMADGTFKREVSLVTSPVTGKRVSETSFDFNGDTSFVTRYTHAGGITSFTINDQFKLDHIGGAVNYSTAANQTDFDLKYQNGDFASRIQYENPAGGSPSKVSVYDQNNVLQYYGLVRYEGSSVRKSARIGGAPQAVVCPRSGTGVAIQLNLSAPGVVRCELMTLSGRVAGILLNEMVPKGHMVRSIATGHAAKVAGGVYLLVVSVNNSVVSCSRYLSDIAVSGGIQ